MFSNNNSSTSTKLSFKDQGNAAFKQKNFKKAISLYTQAILINESDLSILYCNRATANFYLEKYEESNNDAEKAIEINPINYKAFFRLAESKSALSIFPAALAAYQKALEYSEHEHTEPFLRCKIKDTSVILSDQENNVFFKILQPGVDICKSSFNPITKLIYKFARGFQNQIYILGDLQERKVVVVDACWDIDGIVRILHRLNLTLVGAIVTHNHFDHVGGKPPAPFSSYGISVSGVAKLLDKYPGISVYVGLGDVQTFLRDTGIIEERVKGVTDDQILQVGRFDIQFICLPGHTSGSMCLLFNNNRLLTGDTLFRGSCGRTDLENGNSDELFTSLCKISHFSNDLLVYPGHSYGGVKVTSIEIEKKFGVLSIQSQDQWNAFKLGANT